MSWQPIETAPKDGSRVLLWSKHWSASHTGQFYGNWWSSFYEIGPFHSPPTHWQPLPTPPA